MLGHGQGQDAHNRSSGIRKTLYRKFWSKMNMCGAWPDPLYHVCNKETVTCQDHVGRNVVHVLRERSCRSVS